jgi:hypothetical protein
VQAIDASDILAPSELEDSDLLKNEDFSFDLASKSLLFMATANMDDDKLNKSLPNPATTNLPFSSSNSFSNKNLTGKMTKIYFMF